ncbi:unnamed protein product [Soboliphyme baturini]|uniref:Phorbol-ester/DAG-type domain-containing protein n=1 Tax=Soboliphyme baturini TaxID=241478 RepID=A0A183ILM4_9BILA|nr:unnamed protein product [Soboliphyme baturini]
MFVVIFIYYLLLFWYVCILLLSVISSFFTIGSIFSDGWIEANRSYRDTLELQHFNGIEGLIPTGKHEPAIGHVFRPFQLHQLTWCDKCGEFIWGVYKQALRCQICRYTCHYKCRSLVTLDCAYASETTSSSIPTEITYLHPSDCSDANGFAGSSQNVSIALLTAAADFQDENGVSFHGFVRLLINFSRPVNTVDCFNDSSTCYLVDDRVAEKTDQNGTTNSRGTLTSFYLPRNSVKLLHITSDTTTREMIVSLLNKFHIADNPRKFALYERTGHCLSGSSSLKSLLISLAKLRRIPDDACPLRIALLWEGLPERNFVLQENETGEIIWESFEIPELQNFLQILDIEEKQYTERIKKYYQRYRYFLEMEIIERLGHSTVEQQWQGSLKWSSPFLTETGDIVMNCCT